MSGSHLPDMPVYKQLLLSIFWFSQSTLGAAVLVILMPYQVKNMVGEETKGRILGVAVLIGALTGAFSAPVFGHISDMTITRWGRRKPFMALGFGAGAVMLIAMGFATTPATLFLLLVGWGLYCIASSAGAAYNALIPDVVPQHQRGSASGFMGLMTMLGYCVGAGALGFVVDLTGVTVIYFCLIGLNAICLVVTLASFTEPPHQHSSQLRWKEFFLGMISPFKSQNFRWVFFTRFLVVMGMYSVQEFLQYYFQDVIGAPFQLFTVSLQSPAAATGMFTLFLLLGAVIASVPAGKLSDKFGRKIVVYVSCGLQIVAVILMIFLRSFQLLVFIGIIFGVGYGAYVSVEWSLAADTLPSAHDHARDMSLWHIALSVPQAIATPIGGAILDSVPIREWGISVGRTDMNYIVLFIVASIYFVLGTVFVYRINLPHKPGQSGTSHEAVQAMTAEAFHSLPEEETEMAALAEDEDERQADQRRDTTV